MDAIVVLPVMVSSAVAVIVAVYVIMLWIRAHKAPCRGRDMGEYELNGILGGGDLFDRLKGRMVEVTDYFLHPDVKDCVKDALKGSIGSLLDESEEEKPEAETKGQKAPASPATTQEKEQAELREALKKLDEVDLKTCARFYIIQDGVRAEKHLIAQLGGVASNLEFFARHRATKKPTTGSSNLPEHILFGTLQTLPGKTSYEDEYKEFASVATHVFFPEKTEKTDYAKSARDFGFIGAFARFLPLALSIKARLKVKDDEVRGLKHEVHDLTEESAAKTSLILFLKAWARNRGINIPGLESFSQNNTMRFIVAASLILFLGIMFASLGGDYAVVLGPVGSIMGYFLSQVLSQRFLH